MQIYIDMGGDQQNFPFHPLRMSNGIALGGMLVVNLTLQSTSFYMF